MVRAAESASIQSGKRVRDWGLERHRSDNREEHKRRRKDADPRRGGECS